MAQLKHGSFQRQCKEHRVREKTFNPKPRLAVAGPEGGALAVHKHHRHEERQRDGRYSKGMSSSETNSRPTL